MKIPGFLLRSKIEAPPEVLVSVPRWGDAFISAQQLFEAGMYDDALNLLDGVLNGMKGSFGPVIDELRPKVIGLVGVLHFRKGDFRQAQLFTEEALRECRRIGDQEGTRIYTEHLQFIRLSGSARIEDSREMQVRSRIVKAQRLSDDGWYGSSNKALFALLDWQEKDALYRYRGKIFGLLGLNWYRIGNNAEAQRCTEQAVAECERTSDDEGFRIYGANLHLIRAAKPSL